MNPLESINRKIRENKKYNPFNHYFDVNKISEFVREQQSLTLKATSINEQQNFYIKSAIDTCNFCLELRLKMSIVIDSSIFLSYFISSYSSLKDLKSQAPFTFKFNYKNEDEFNNNIENYYKTPPNLQNALQFIEISNMKIGGSKEIYTKIAQFHSNIFDISNP
jgi:hypothetical protein